MEQRARYVTTNSANGSIRITSPGRDKIAIYRDMIRHTLGVCSCVFELVTGHKPPKAKDVL